MADKTIDLHTTMAELSVKRPVFYSEADFQHALAWEIQSKHPDFSIRLEYRPPYLDKKAYVDIWAKSPETNFVIELKYKTKGTKITFNEEDFELLNQGAQDIGRYDFLKDVERIEKVVSKNPGTVGYGIFLTNEDLYWKQLDRELTTVDASFRINAGKTIKGTVSWGKHASEGTMKNREKPISLKDTYEIAWHDYSNIAHAKYGHFKYLLLTVK
jgi:hypothetical protein